MRTHRLVVLVACLALAAGLALVAGADSASEVGALDALVPREPGPHAPAFADALGEGLRSDVLARVGDCATCHAEIAEEWAASAHGFASFDNPWYRFAVDRFRERAGHEPSRFCGGCHDIALLAVGGLDRHVAPEDPLARVGVSCLLCHGTGHTTVDGNGSFVASMAPIPIPTARDPESLPRHIARLSTTDTVQNDLCVTCHRGFLGLETASPHFLVGMDDATDWERSAWAGTGIERYAPAPRRGCIDCHMRAGEAVSHRFPGAHTLMAAGLGDREQLAAVQARLRDAVTVRVVRAERDAAGGLAIDVVVSNTGVGHSFPGGTRDLQDTWLEVSVRDDAGNLWAGAGLEHEASGEDPTAHRFAAAPVDEAGIWQRFHLVSRFVAMAWDTTIPARDARLVRYRVAPDTLGAAAGALGADRDATPLRVEATVRHRRHQTIYSDAVCDAAGEARGRAFVATSRAMGRAAIDPCVVPPVTDIGSAALSVGEGPEGWRAHYDYALALSHAQSELVAEAWAPLERARELVRTEGPEARAMVESLASIVATRLGRLDDALGYAAAAEAIIGPHPSVDFRRGEAYAAVWRWEEALAAYHAAAEALPESDVAWAAVAQAAASAGQHELALEATARGLEMQPRHAGMLLNRWMALRALGASAEAVAAAHEAYLRHRPSDLASAARYRCYSEALECGRERAPVHTHEL